MDFGIAEKYKGVCNLRFDDTNPVKEDVEYVDSIQQDIAWLGFKWGNIYYASDYFQQLYDLAIDFIKQGKAYAANNGDVYYAVREFAAYGQLSGKSLDDLRAGERVEIDGFKRDPLDFVLWKAAKEGEPAWQSPWAS
jgi:cysteinyl-tRNA synthetase